MVVGIFMMLWRSKKKEIRRRSVQTKNTRTWFHLVMTYLIKFSGGLWLTKWNTHGGIAWERVSTMFSLVFCWCDTLWTKKINPSVEIIGLLQRFEKQKSLLFHRCSQYLVSAYKKQMCRNETLLDCC